MPAVVTDQFRISNASNFIDSIADTSNSYYVFLGLANPTGGGGVDEGGLGIGRTSTWNSGNLASIPSPIDNFQYQSLYAKTSLFAKKINSSNARRVIKKYTWTANTSYDMYRHDYDIVKNPTPNGNSNLYNTNYYTMNSDYRVYICIDNGSSGTLPKGKKSLNEPTFTDLEPSPAGDGSDGYIWKYLFTVNPSDIIKFDSTDYIVLPNNWSTSTDSQIQTVREAGDSDIYKNQIKKVYIKDVGKGYASGSHTVNILGDGTGAKALVTVDSDFISSVEIVSGGSGYTYGILDLNGFNSGADLASGSYATLIPIIPPSKGHGYDLYKELGADKVLVYARFDNSTKDFPDDTHFGQVGIIKNPQQYGSTQVYTGSEYSSLNAMMLTSSSVEDDLLTAGNVVGVAITQTRADNKIAKGYVASYDKDTKVLKYWQDRSLYFPNHENQKDNINVDEIGNVLEFTSTGGEVKSTFPSNSFDVSIDSNMSGITTAVGNKIVNLGVEFTNGLANPEINKKTGDIIYIDNRKEVERDSRQKEDVKIILEF